MIFIVGYQPKIKEIGPVEEIQCTNCNNKKHWMLAREISYITFFFLPVFPLRSKYYQYCPICGLRQDLSSEDFQRQSRRAALNREALSGQMDAGEYEEKLKDI